MRTLIRKKKKIALLDFDGTLSGRYISMGFLDYLFQHGYYPTKLYQKQMKALKNCQAKKVSYEVWVEEWGRLWARGLKGNKAKDVVSLTEDFFKTFKKNIYPSSYHLIELLKHRGYFTLLISAGAFEVINIAGQDLGVDEVHATEVLSRQGTYLSRLKTNLHKARGKKIFIERLINSGKFEWDDSIAFGDSLQDARMLERVKIPVALNPSKEMNSLAIKNKWMTLNHRNVVNRLKNLL